MRTEPLDLRLVPSALAAWSLAAVGVGWSPGQAVVGALALLSLGVVILVAPTRRSVRRGWTWAVAAALVVGSGALGVAGLRAGVVSAGPVPDLALQGAQVTVRADVSSDPVRREGRFAPYVVLRANALEVTGRGVVSTVRSPLLVIADESWLGVALGDSITGSGRLSPGADPDVAAVLLADKDPLVTDPAGWVFAGVGRVRHAIAEAAAPLPAAQRALVPALVDGDDSAMPDDIAADFKETGLTHLLAVSGSNLTLVLGFTLLVARWCGVTGRGTAVVGLVSVVFFVLLARPEPSVLRAAAMGVVALAGLSAGGHRRGMRSLCAAVGVLVLLDPWLARSVGFLLSTLATGGIVVLAPVWRDALAGWLPRPLAEAIAVPMAAQIVCTPAIAAISGQVSLVAVLSNLLAAVAVGPTTVVGLVAGLAGLLSSTAGHLLGWVAGVPAWWIVTVATRTAALDGASVAWPVGSLTLIALSVLCLFVVGLLSRVLRRRVASLALATVTVLLVVHPVGRIGWRQING